jgi:hypothetical protein
MEGESSTPQSELIPYVVRSYAMNYPYRGRLQSYTDEKRHIERHKNPFSMPFPEGVNVNKYPFSIFKRADRPCFLVSFKDETGKFMPPISTKKNTEAEAFKVAFQWLQEGIPQE